MIGGHGAAAPGPASTLAKVDAFQLGSLEVRPSTREVMGDGVSLVLEPRVMQVLVALAGRRETVVSRSELIDECWAGRAVGDDAINRCIQAIRRIAEGHGGFSIRTVARVGYRLEEEAGFHALTCDQAEASVDKGSPSQTLVIRASERRHLTILSCGLVIQGSDLDPEAKFEIAAEWRRRAYETVCSFGAHVDSGRRDHLLACFGYPEAQEDAAVRAVRAGLAIVELLPALNVTLRETQGVDLSVRIGIHAGTVVVAHGADAELFGDALDISSRIESLAAPNQVTITDAVVDMLSGQFMVEPAGALKGDGEGEPLSIHRVRSAGLASERRRSGKRSPFVGRDEPLALLADRWDRVRHGAGQLVLIQGEPGIGKSRLVEAFRERLASDPHLWIECNGEPLFANTQLYAAAQMLWRGLGWRGDESAEERSAALDRALERSGLKVAEAVPLVAGMLGLPVVDRHPPLLLAPEQRRRRLLATLAEWLFSATRSKPLVLVIEDLQWLDPSSLELLHRLAEQGANSPLLLLCTARPDFHASWPARSHQIQIAIGGLTADEIRSLVTGLVAEETLDCGSVDAIVGRADGIPLFAEALTRLIGEQAGPDQIPATLMDSLAARLDRLGDAKAVAQMAAVIGRSFSWEMLRALSPLPDETLQLALEQLSEAGLIHARGSSPDERYRFEHALMRDSAYEQLPSSQRRHWHQRIASAMATGVVRAEPEELAYHWTQAGDADRAIAAWANAGAHAYARSALAEAAQAYRQALSILATLPDTPARDSRELELSAAFSLALVPAAGPQTAEIAAIAARNHELAGRCGDIGVLVTARTYAVLAATFRSEWEQATRLAWQVSELARHDGGAIRPETLAYARAMAHFCHLTVAFYRGDLLEAERHFSGWEALNRERQYEERAVIVMAYGNGAILAWHLGDLDEAHRRRTAARAHAEGTDSPFDHCSCLMIDALRNVFLRDAAAAERLAGQALAMARERNFVQVEGWAGATLGWARAQLGAPAEGVDLIRASLLLLAKCDTRVSLPLFLTMLAEAMALDGDVGGAFESLEEALTICPPERQYRPHTLTCRGELAAAIGDIGQAEASFREAIATAELMGAVSCKQRASIGLGALRAI